MNKVKSKAVALFSSILLLTVVAVGGTVAFLITQTDPVVNTFTPSHVTCEVTEDFNGTVKSNVNVTNTSDTEAYIRVKFITYRVNAAGQRIGGIAEIPAFTPGTNWKEHNGFYYYTLPVAAGGKPANDLIGSTGITLVEYNDVDGGKQVIEVMAEAIQSKPAQAIGESWGVVIAENSVTVYTKTN